MKKKYDRSELLVDHVIDLRPESIRNQQLPVNEITVSPNRLELIFENILKRS